MATDVRLETPKVLISANPRSACRVTERGPNWLFIRAPRGRLLGYGRQQPTISEEIWQLADRHLIYRIILHVEEVEGLDVTAVAEIVQLQELLVAAHGSLRLCGLRPDCGRQLLRDMHCDSLHNYATPHDAVLGYPCSDQPTDFNCENSKEFDGKPVPTEEQRSWSKRKPLLRSRRPLPR